MERTPIKSFASRVVFDSRGSETIEIDVFVKGGYGRASAPAGASVGKLEAPGFPKGGASASLEQLKKHGSRFLGANAADPHHITKILREIDGTDNYSRIGGSAAFALSIASASASSSALGVPLYQILGGKIDVAMPISIGNVLGGGKHAGSGAPDIQEFLSCPVGARNIFEAVKANVEVHREVRKEIERRDPTFSGGKGDEGAWAPKATDAEALEIVSRSVGLISKKMGFEVRMGLDLASTSLWDEEGQVYRYRRSGLRRSPEEQLRFVLDVIDHYRPIYIEDPFHETDFDSFSKLTRQAKGTYIVGDDLFVTNEAVLTKGIEKEAGNAVILKVNQAGSLGDALRFSELARRSHYEIITSHRSGDTCDAHIAHVAVGTSSVMIKTGVVGGERIAKLNELIRIDEEYLKDRGKHIPMKKMALHGQ